MKPRSIFESTLDDTIPITVSSLTEFQHKFPGIPIEKSRGGVIQQHECDGVTFVSKEHKLTSPEKQMNAMNELISHEFLCTAASNRLVSPHYGIGANYICPMYRSVRTPESAFIIMEKGERVFNWITDNWDANNVGWREFLRTQPPDFYRQHKSPWEKMIQGFAKEMVLAVRYIHALGLTHGDIKLENMIKVGNTIKLIDFESCKAYKPKSMDRFGTPQYGSPEYQCGSYDAAMNDVWSLGVALFCLLFKFPPCETMTPADDRFCMLVAGSEYDRQFEVSSGCLTACQQVGIPANLEGLLRLYNRRDCISDEGLSFMSMFWKPEKTRGTFDEMMAHPWFKNCDHPANEILYNTLYTTTPSKSHRPNVYNEIAKNTKIEFYLRGLFSKYTEKLQDQAQTDLFINS